MTLRAVVSALPLGAGRITVVDQTPNLEGRDHPSLMALSIDVIKAPGVAFFSGFAELVRQDAMAKGLDAYFWMHSDAALGDGVARAGLASLCIMYHSNVPWARSCLVLTFSASSL